MEKVSRVKKSGLTFAAEAGTQRLRDVINKNVTEEEVLSTCKTAFEGGYTSVKLYFMMGLPTETMEDIEGIANLAQKVVDLLLQPAHPPEGPGRSASPSSCACFVPKPFTPFQFEGQDTMELLREKQKHLLASVKSKKISVSYHDADVSFIEAILAKGDRRMGPVILSAWKKGSKLDGWYEYLRPAALVRCDGRVRTGPGFLRQPPPRLRRGDAVGSSGLLRQQGVFDPGKIRLPARVRPPHSAASAARPAAPTA